MQKQQRREVEQHCRGKNDIKHNLVLTSHKIHILLANRNHIHAQWQQEKNKHACCTLPKLSPAHFLFLQCRIPVHSRQGLFYLFWSPRFYKLIAFAPILSFMSLCKDSTCLSEGGCFALSCGIEKEIGWAIWQFGFKVVGSRFGMHSSPVKPRVTSFQSSNSPAIHSPKCERTRFFSLLKTTIISSTG